MDIDLDRFEVTLPGGVTYVRCRSCGQTRRCIYTYEALEVEAWAEGHDCGGS